MTVQLLFCGMMLPGSVQYSSENSCAIAITHEVINLVREVDGRENPKQ